MALSDFLEKLQNKPRPIRVIIMWVGVTISMAILFTLWVWSLTSENQISAGDQSEGQIEDSLSAAANLKEQVPTLWQSIKSTAKGFFEPTPNDSTVKSIEKNSQEKQKELESQQNNNQQDIPPASLP